MEARLFKIIEDGKCARKVKGGGASAALPWLPGVLTWQQDFDKSTLAKLAEFGEEGEGLSCVGRDEEEELWMSGCEVECQMLWRSLLVLQTRRFAL